MIRVWRNGVLVQRMCIAKTNDQYFTGDEAAQPCGTGMLVMPKFWWWHPTGNLDAQICNNHATIILNREPIGRHLRENIEQAIRRPRAFGETNQQQNELSG